MKYKFNLVYLMGCMNCRGKEKIVIGKSISQNNEGVLNSDSLKPFKIQVP